MSNSKNILNFALRFGFSVLLLLIVFSIIDLEKTKTALAEANLLYIAYGGAIFIVVVSLMLWRWFIFIKALDLSVSSYQAIRYYLMGLFGNLFLPSAVGGDIIKVVGLCRGSNQKARVVASVLLDRLSGFAAIVIIAVCAFTLGYAYIDDKALIIPIALMAGGSIAIVAVLFTEKYYMFACRIFNKLPTVKQALMKMHYDVVLLKDKKKDGAKAIAISCVTQTMLAITYYVVAKGLHQNVEVIYFLIFVPMISVASVLPSIGGLGVREAGAAYLFARIGMDPGIAVSMSLINFFYMTVVGIFGGFIYLATPREKLQAQT